MTAQAGAADGHDSAKGEFGGRAVSVIIGSYRRYETLPLIVSSLRRQRGVRVEIIVADAGSSPSLQAALPALDVDRYVYHHPDGLYHRVRSFNEMAERASHDIIVLLDDDVVPMSDYWAWAAVEALSSNPGASIARMPVIIKEFREDLSDAEGRQQELLSLDWSNAIVGFSTCNIAVRRSAWAALGGLGWRFDGVYGEEDLEFHRRAGAAGLKYVSAAPFGCALHVGLFYGNRQKEGLVGGGSG